MTRVFRFLNRLLFAATLVLGGCQTFLPPQDLKKPVSPKLIGALPEDKEDFVERTEFPVAILVPLTGSDSYVGQSLYDAAKLALFNTSGHRVALLPFDTKSSEQGSVKALDKAIERGARVIIGPLRSNEVVAIKIKARRHRVPLIAFTNDIAVGESGIFVFGFDISEQIKRLFQYTFNRGIRTVVAVIPKNALGERLLKDMNDVRSDGLVKILDIIQYDPKSQRHIEELKTIKDKRYDAIFIPEGGANLKTIVSSFLYHGINIKASQLLGTGLWLDQDAKSIPTLQGAWLVAPSIAGFEKFSALYYNSYKSYPPRVSTLAFDAIQMIAALSKNQTVEDPFAIDILCKTRGFLGVDGLFRLNEKGDTERGLAVYAIMNQQLEVIEASQKDFFE